MLRTWKFAAAALAAGLLAGQPAFASGWKHGHVKRQAGATVFTSTSTVASVGSVVSLAPATVATTSVFPVTVSGTSLFSNTLSSFPTVLPSAMTVNSLPVSANWVAMSPVMVNSGTAGVATTTSSGCNTGTDSSLVQAVQNLTQAVNANTQAVNALAQRLPSRTPVDPPPDSPVGAPPVDNPFGAPPASVAGGRIQAGGDPMRSFLNHLDQSQRALATYLQKHPHLKEQLTSVAKEHDDHVRRMKEKLKALNLPKS
jgi:hypothetical protein